MKNPFLIGDQVYLRPLEREDALSFVAWLNDAEVTRNLRPYLPINLRAEEAFLDKLYQGDQDITLGIALKATDELIGGAGLHKKIDARSRQASFGIFIGKKAEWGKGHGTDATRLIVRYAFDTLNLNRVWLHVDADNQRAVRSYEKVGFRKEGVLRQDRFREGRYGDTVVMAILRDEWPATDRA